MVGIIESRCSIRLKGYDYSQTGAYFATPRACKIVAPEWERSAVADPVFHPGSPPIRNIAGMMNGVIMASPNHLHDIVVITETRRSSEHAHTRHIPGQKVGNAHPTPVSPVISPLLQQKDP
ncbi:MAG: hypothetical protein GDA44_00125 [Prochloron sp. SP5CPC1]|nr:hypothetical protein [Candidatus Paraprochloron terpiosi SP5CPC1]